MRQRRYHITEDEGKALILVLNQKTISNEILLKLASSYTTENTYQAIIKLLDLKEKLDNYQWRTES